jgi:hypothetical protein
VSRTRGPLEPLGKALGREIKKPIEMRVLVFGESGSMKARAINDLLTSKVPDWGSLLQYTGPEEKGNGREK